MRLDNTLVKEIRESVGNGSRKTAFRLLRRVSDACVDLSRAEIRSMFN